ncbi:restriction endonuclease subunit S, partial [uncultured Phocaeicola sp.]
MENNTTMRRLGDFIRQVDVRNKDLTVTNLVGLSIDKKYIPSVANIVGTDLSNYKVIRENQFACSLMQVSRDKKMPIAIYKGVDAIMSPAYPIFEVIDNSVLLPDYLQLWFVREEFDREATFYAIGGVRGSLEWGDFCDIKIPVPPIEDQLAIVARHKAIEHKIDVNHRLIATLEETARTIYRHTFIDNIDPENLPQGWRCVSISEIAEVNIENISFKDNFTTIDYLDSGSITNNYISGFQHLVVGEDEIPSRAKRKVRYNDIVYSTVRPNLKHFGILKCDATNLIVSTAFAVIHSITEIPTEVIYLALTQQTAIDEFQNIAEMSKATYPSITADDIMAQKILLPDNADFSCFSGIFNMIDSLNRWKRRVRLTPSGTRDLTPR